MSLEFWDAMPVGFLKMSYQRWRKLDFGVKQVVAELAENQKFRCALCSRTRDLVIEHDHEPDEGPGDQYTIFNIRGLVCQRCNWHLMLYEKQENGEYLNWDNAVSYISSSKYESYNYVYRCRISPLIEVAIERRLGSTNYWRRRITLQKFDAWRYDGEYSAWRESWARRRAWKINTPEDFFRNLQTLTKFYAEQMERDQDFVPPDEFVKLIARVRSLIEISLANRRLINVATNP